jgi:hypothetical protein
MIILILVSYLQMKKLKLLGLFPFSVKRNDILTKSFLFLCEEIMPASNVSSQIVRK